MPQNILVASPHPAFGELLRLSLEETGSYSVRLVLSGKEVLSVISHMSFDLALLDASLRDEPFAPMVRVLLEQLPDIKLAIFPPENDPHHPLMMGLRPHAYLEKPFYLPDLISLVEGLLHPVDQQIVEALAKPVNRTINGGRVTAPLPDLDEGSARRTAESVPWLQDVDLAAQHLTRLLLETNAQAAIILREGAIWAYAGQLLQPEAQEIAVTVQRYWDKHKKTDLARYIRLDTGEYLTYATPLVENLLLATAFEISVPLTRVRAQAGRLARELATPLPPVEVPPLVEALPEEELVGPALTEEERGAILALLADMPPPDPDGNSDPLDEWQPETNLPAWAREPVPVITVQPDPPADPDVEKTQPTAVNGAIHLPVKVAEFDPASPAVSLITYTGLLIPRFEEHFLTGELGILLGQWVPELCVAFGWRLDGISVRPEHFMWTVRVLPAVSPGNMVRILRQQISMRIFNAMPLLKSQNPSGDFWAPGYLIVSGSQAPPPDLLRDYIEQTRRRQGITAVRNKKERKQNATHPVSD